MLNNSKMCGVDIFEIKSALQKIQKTIEAMDILRDITKECCTNRTLYSELLDMDNYIDGAYNKAASIIQELKEGRY